MRKLFKMALLAPLFAMALLVTAPVQAEEEGAATNEVQMKAQCQKEAADEGIIDANEVADYVAQCLEAMRAGGGSED